MKREILQETTFCDHCKEQTYVHQCLNCEIELCWKCFEKLGAKYNHGVHFAGSGDGYYCRTCDFKLIQLNDNPLHMVYLAIKRLRDESRLWWLDFDKRSKVAEAELKRISKL